MFKATWKTLLWVGCAGLCCAVAWQGLFSLQLCRLFVFDADAVKLAELKLMNVGDSVELSVDGGMANARNGWIPSAEWGRPNLTGGLLPYHTARVLGWVLDPPPGTPTPQVPVPNTLGPGSLTISIAIRQFGMVILLGVVLTASTATATFTAATFYIKGCFIPRRRYNRLIARSAVRHAAIAVPLITLILAYATYDRGVFYGPPVPDLKSIFLHTLLSVGFGGLLGLRIGRRVRCSSHSHRRHCANCGYDLVGVDSELRCPECGMTRNESSKAPPHLLASNALLVMGYALALTLVVLWTPLVVVTTALATRPTFEGAGDFLGRWAAMRVTNDMHDRGNSGKVWFMISGGKVFHGE